MILYKLVYVYGQANTEVFKDLITSTEVEPVTVRKIYITEVSTTPVGDGVLRLYIEREKIAEIPLCNFLTNLTDKKYHSQPVYEINVDIPVGQTLIAGLISSSTASSVAITLEYEITARR